MNLLIVSNFPEVFKLWKHHLMRSGRSQDFGNNQPLQMKKSQCEVFLIMALERRTHQTLVSPFHMHKSTQLLFQAALYPFHPILKWAKIFHSGFSLNSDFVENMRVVHLEIKFLFFFFFNLHAPRKRGKIKEQ